VLLIGVVLGMAYSMACSGGGSQQRADSGQSMSVPGIPVAMAQTNGEACERWEVVSLTTGFLEVNSQATFSHLANGAEVNSVLAPPGWVPLNGDSTLLWFARCSK
jgi:hypothetical protein